MMPEYADTVALARRYAPVIHIDENETIPLIAFGITVFDRTCRSQSFPRREVTVPDGCRVIEYACFWDYDIQHMYDLEHIWVTVDTQGQVIHAEGSFHGKYLNLYDPDMPCCTAPTDGHIHAFCQPGKHAFLPDGQLFRLIPGWRECCNALAGGEVLVGGPFGGLYHPSRADHARCARYIRENLTFRPTLRFLPMADKVQYMMWEEMARWIPERIRAECVRLEKMYE